MQFYIPQKALKDLIGKLHFYYYCTFGSVSIDLNSEQVVKCFACYLGSLSYKTSPPNLMNVFGVFLMKCTVMLKS